MLSERVIFALMTDGGAPFDSHSGRYDEAEPGIFGVI
jgi:hypothetical protein